eukprot:gnl/MRDRNA2_/MRDRNA2_74668_c0_seq1.p1 gnl/MRDRNA2_/MRDRNA2_74668_c0~~gnl/MRDRNA2_/MRDRNA2_74668_c0_seq1.p1  ORF type:complete len:603 (+),score=136.63 gnl/MRDRNA2_/MRDRNA2_74668_c0_seq1:127-1809(+)
MTATLLREGTSSASSTQKSDKSIWPLLGNCVYHADMTDLTPTYLCPVRCVEVRVPVEGPEWAEIFKSRPLTSTVCLSRGKWLVLEHLLAIHANEKVLITVERCEQARMVATTFGIPPLDGSVSGSDTQVILERFRSGSMSALVATHVLDDSADIPELSVLIQMSGHFGSRRQEKQRLGRLMRWGPQKRKRYDSDSQKPTFYVLVHEGTAEDQMRERRRSGVSELEYERISADDVKKDSPLFRSDVFSGRGNGEDATKRFLAMSQRIANSLPQGGASSEHLAEIRKWFRKGGDGSKGSTLPREVLEIASSDEPLEENSSSENSSGAADTGNVGLSKGSGKGKGRCRDKGTGNGQGNAKGTSKGIDSGSTSSDSSDESHSGADSSSSSDSSVNTDNESNAATGLALSDKAGKIGKDASSKVQHSKQQQKNPKHEQLQLPKPKVQEQVNKRHQQQKQEQGHQQRLLHVRQHLGKPEQTAQQQKQLKRKRSESFGGNHASSEAEQGLALNMSTSHADARKTFTNQKITNEVQHPAVGQDNAKVAAFSQCLGGQHSSKTIELDLD